MGMAYQRPARIYGYDVVARKGEVHIYLRGRLEARLRHSGDWRMTHRRVLATIARLRGNARREERM